MGGDEDHHLACHAERWQKVSFTEEHVRLVGLSRKDTFDERSRCIDRGKADTDVRLRHSARECKCCFYGSAKIVGHAFTEFQCKACGNTFCHPNTSTPKLCNDCADTLLACVRCGGTRDW